MSVFPCSYSFYTCSRMIRASSLPSSLRILCSCFDAAALLSPLLQQQGGRAGRETRKRWFLSFHLTGTQTDTLSGKNGERDKACMPTVPPAGPGSRQMFSSEREITSASGATAGLCCSSAVHWNNCLQDLREEVRVQWLALQYKLSLYHSNDEHFFLRGSVIQAWKQITRCTWNSTCLS